MDTGLDYFNLSSMIASIRDAELKNCFIRLEALATKIEILQDSIAFKIKTWDSSSITNDMREELAYCREQYKINQGQVSEIKKRINFKFPFELLQEKTDE